MMKKIFKISFIVGFIFLFYKLNNFEIKNNNNCYALELGSGTGSGYPTIIDTDNILESTSTVARADVPNDLADAIIKTEKYAVRIASWTPSSQNITFTSGTYIVYGSSIIATSVGYYTFYINGINQILNVNFITNAQGEGVLEGNARIFLSQVYTTSFTVKHNGTEGGQLLWQAIVR